MKFQNEGAVPVQVRTYCSKIREQSAPLLLIQPRNPNQSYNNSIPEQVPSIECMTLVARLFLKRLGFEKIFKTQGIFKTQKSALLVLWKGVINPPLQSLVNQRCSQRENC